MKYKAEAYCSATEHCPFEVMTKLSQWGADEAMSERILLHLQKERYVDSARYCRAFVRDKYRFARWGRMKIVQALRMKHLSSEDIEAGMAEIDEEEYEKDCTIYCVKRASPFLGETNMSVILNLFVLLLAEGLR